MSNRRDFLRTAGQATVGAWLTGGTVSGLAQPVRRDVRIAGQPATVVDIHAHCVFPEVAAILPAGMATPFNAGFPGLTLGPDRLEVMDARGIDVQALSVNQYWWYAEDRDLAQRIVRMHDEGLAEWCEAYPDRFVALSSVALQFPDLAAAQLEYAVNELGHRGASIGGHVANEPPTSAEYDAFWAKAQELDVPIFMHPNNAMNVVREGGLAGRGNLGNIVGNPLETTVFLTHMMFDGVLDRFPRLKVCGAHGGGYLPSYFGRTEVACGIRANANCANQKLPSEYLRDQVFVDTMVFSEEGLRHLVAETGVSQIVYGSDIPYDWPDTIDIVVDSPSLSDADKRAILGGNLVELLRIET
ncbi:amidohydrolase family protein [Candidatus Rariloculus sp.]|uniref:amidohydrolase family protein n=1 Tax=Candidatus Rariloculus sp. TaxID=3101265 RepID=UPI003D0D9432